MNKQEIQETINELHRMKKRLSGAQGCSVHHEEANAYTARCLSIAISALEKQIPKKADISEDNEKSCPVCDCEILGYYANYCEHCGQSIDWRNEDE